jgi:AcrR family transcriptional regulator
MSVGGRTPVSAGVRGTAVLNGGPALRAGAGGVHLATVQRRRLIAAMVELAGEYGVDHATVARVSRCAGVSRKTFYDVFADSEECFLAAFDEVVLRFRNAVIEATVGKRRWVDRVRAGLTLLVELVEDEPATGRVLIVEALRAGDRVLDHRRRVLAEIIGVVEGGRLEARSAQPPPALAAEGVVGAVFSVIHARLSDPVSGPLTELTGELMGTIVLPYLGPAAARRESGRPTPMRTRTSARHMPTGDAFDGLSIRITYRTARVLSAIAEQPGASNRQIARAAGIADEGQTSRLLTRLQHAGLIHNTGGTPASGEARAWTLTDRGAGIQGAVAES